MYPERIVCLTEEPTEVLYAIGESRRIVGISEFTVRPARARREKPKVSTFTDTKVDHIVALQPDLAIGFSDIQAEIAQALALPRRPRIYFEEWDEPQISAIRWVSELISIAGGDDIFPQRAASSLALDRIVTDPDEVVRQAPDIIIASWCGKRVRPERIAARPGWDTIPAVRTGHVYEIKSPIILQPGPAALTDGLATLHGIISRWATTHPV